MKPFDRPSDDLPDPEIMANVWIIAVGVFLGFLLALAGLGFLSEIWKMLH